jgi:unsaturated rhamnogalacturonyl hydrolase
MKNIKTLFSVLVTLVVLSACSATRKLSKNEVLAPMQITNQYFMNKWPDAGKSIVTNKERPSNIWTRAVYYEGLMALYSLDPKKEYYEYAVQWGDKHNWGLRNGIETRNADDQACGQTYIDLYLIEKNPERIKDIKASVDLMVKSEKSDDWNWIDALQMAMPVFTRLGVIYNDTSYFSKIYDLYSYTKYRHGDNGLYNPADTCGGGIRILIRHTKSQMAKIVTGVGVTAG